MGAAAFTLLKLRVSVLVFADVVALVWRFGVSVPPEVVDCLLALPSEWPPCLGLCSALFPVGERARIDSAAVSSFR